MNPAEQAQTYARAVYQSALDVWLKHLGAARVAYETNELVRTRAASRHVADRLAAAAAITPHDAPPEVRNFLSLLADKGHLDLLGDVATGLGRLVRKGPNVRVARVVSAVPMTEDEAAQLRAKLLARFGGDLEFDFRVDPNILGGVVVQVGDQVIDGSVAGKLTAMKATLAGTR
ncbi:MAG: ATP synthase F1 subunit delta [Anaerolineae bacterium]|nr:ATP synthase F1 subunit delta [Anaerolineae bacterium]